VAGVRSNVKELLQYSTEEKKRNFLETVELQIGLKNYGMERQYAYTARTLLRLGVYRPAA
jgi:large subunit ribosomal protein L10Ae